MVVTTNMPKMTSIGQFGLKGISQKEKNLVYGCLDHDPMTCY